jgi:uncharacterized protein YjiS (DUF1127 family)
MQHWLWITKGNEMTRSAISERAGFGGSVVAVPPRRWFAALLQVMALRQSRRRLAVMDDATLRDLGLTREEALAEADKPIWNVPAHWLR